MILADWPGGVDLKVFVRGTMITAVALWYGSVAAATLAVGGWSAKKSNAGPFVWSSWIVTAALWPLMMPIALLADAVDE